MASGALVKSIRRQRFGDLIRHAGDGGARSSPVVGENAEDQSLAVRGGYITGERSRRGDRTGLRVYVPFSRSALHAALERTVHTGNGQCIVEDSESSVVLNFVENADECFRRDE